MNAAQFAQKVKVDEKKVRKFLREVTPPKAQPGRGGTWTLPEDRAGILKLKRQYARWALVHTRVPAPRKK